MKTWTLRVFLGAVVLAGIAAGVVTGAHYYNHHKGDWHIGLTAAGIGAGVIAGAVVLATVLWLLLKPRRNDSDPAAEWGSAPTSTMKYETTNLIDILSMLGAIGAGAYLLSYSSPGDSAVTGTSWLEIIAHGMGIYFIAKGLFIARTTHLQADARNKLAQLVELAAWEADRKEDDDRDAAPKNQPTGQ